MAPKATEQSLRNYTYKQLQAHVLKHEILPNAAFKRTVLLEAALAAIAPAAKQSNTKAKGNSKATKPAVKTAPKGAQTKRGQKRRHDETAVPGPSPPKCSRVRADEQVGKEELEDSNVARAQDRQAGFTLYTVDLKAMSYERIAGVTAERIAPALATELITTCLNSAKLAAPGTATVGEWQGRLAGYCLTDGKHALLVAICAKTTPEDQLLQVLRRARLAPSKAALQQIVDAAARAAEQPQDRQREVLQQHNTAQTSSTTSDKVPHNSAVQREAPGTQHKWRLSPDFVDFFNATVVAASTDVRPSTVEALLEALYKGGVQDRTGCAVVLEDELPRTGRRTVKADNLRRFLTELLQAGTAELEDEERERHRERLKKQYLFAVLQELLRSAFALAPLRELSSLKKRVSSVEERLAQAGL